jgi:hypothetical protein
MIIAPSPDVKAKDVRTGGMPVRVMLRRPICSAAGMVSILNAEDRYSTNQLASGVTIPSMRITPSTSADVPVCSWM